VADTASAVMRDIGGCWLGSRGGSAAIAEPGHAIAASAAVAFAATRPVAAAVADAVGAAVAPAVAAALADAVAARVAGAGLETRMVSGDEAGICEGGRSVGAAYGQVRSQGGRGVAGHCDRRQGREHGSQCGD
jgi:hypothetical protein